MIRFCLLLFLFAVCSAGGLAQDEDAPAPAPPRPESGPTIDLTKRPIPPPKQVTESFDRTPFTNALRRLFNATDPPTPYRLETYGFGTITADFEASPLDTALEKVLAQVRPLLGYTVINGMYHIVPRLAHGEANLTPPSLRYYPPTTRPDGSASGGDSLFGAEGRPELIVQSGNAERIIAVAFSPDGRYIASGGDENTTAIWSVATRKLVHTLPGRMSPNPFLPDRQTIVTATGNKIFLWNLKTGLPEQIIPAHTKNTVQCVSVSASGSIVSTGYDNTIQYWPEPGKRYKGRIWPTPYAVCNACFDPSGRWIAAYVMQEFVPDSNASDNKKKWKTDPNRLLLFNLNEKWGRDAISLPIRTLTVEKADKKPAVSDRPPVFEPPYITGVAFHPKSNLPYVAVATRDSQVQLWNYRTRTKIKTFTCAANTSADEPGNINARSGRIADTVCAFSPDGRYLAASGADNQIILWEVETRRRHRQFPGHPLFGRRGYVSASALAFNRDGTRLLSGAYISGSSPSKITIWNVAAGVAERNFMTTVRDFRLVDFNKEGSKIIAAGTNEVRLWDTGMVHPPQTLPAVGLNQPDSPSFALSPDRSLFAARLRDHAHGDRLEPGIALFDTKSGRVSRTLVNPKKFEAEPSCVAFRPDSKVIAIGWHNGDISQLDVETGQRVTENLTDIHSSELHLLLYSGDGKTLFSQDMSGQCAIWDTATGELLHRFGNLPNGAQFVTAPPPSPDAPEAINTPIPEEHLHAPWQDFPRRIDAGRIVISPNATGRRYLAVIQNPSIRLYDLTTGQYLWAAPGFTAAFFPNGLRIAIGNGDNTDFYFTDSGKPDTSLLRGHLSGGNNLITLGPNGDVLAATTSGQADKVRVYWPGRVILKLTGHAGIIQAIGISADGSRVVTGGRDSTVRLWNVLDARRSQEEMAAFVGIDDEDFIVTLPDNHYMATRNALKKVAFRVGDVPFPFEQFDLTLNRPDLILERLGKAPPDLLDTYRNAFRKRLAQLNLKESDLATDFHLPTLQVIGEVPETYGERDLGVTVRAVDEEFGIRAIQVFVNDVPVYGSGGLDVSKQYQQTIEQNLHLALMRGRNKIQFSTINGRGIESRRLTYEVTCTAFPIQPTLHVVTIGVSHYQDPAINTLPLAAKDAREMAAFLSTLGPVTGWSPTKPVKRLSGRPLVPQRSVASLDSEPDYGSAYQAVRVHPPLVDGDATRDRIQGLRTFLQETRPEDQVIVFFAGHGFLDPRNREYYFGTPETASDHLEDTALNYKEIEQLLDGIPARQKLLLLDTCYSGEVDASVQITRNKTVASAEHARLKRGQSLLFLEDGPSTAFELMQSVFADLRRGSGAMVISAAGGTQTALEDRRLGNGVFTHSVLNALRNRAADANGDGRVTVSELREYVTAEVGKITNGEQKPVSRRENIEFDFPLLITPR